VRSGVSSISCSVDLKPDDICVALRAIADPDAHQAVQVTRTHAATGGHVRNTQAPVLTLNFMTGRGHNAVQARLLEALYQKPLEYVDAPFRCIWVKFLCHEVMKGSGLGQSDRPPHQGIHGNPADEKCAPGRSRMPISSARSLKHRSSGRTSGPRKNHSGRPAILQPNGNRSATVRYDTDRGVALRRHNPEASNEGAQRVGGLMEPSVGAVDASAANTHPSDQVPARTAEKPSIAERGAKTQPKRLKPIDRLEDAL
jgi:hypothetical protein